MSLLLPEQPPVSRRDLENKKHSGDLRCLQDTPLLSKFMGRTCLHTQVHVHTRTHGDKGDREALPNLFLVSQEAPIQLIWRPEAAGRWGNKGC